MDFEVIKGFIMVMLAFSAFIIALDYVSN